MGVLHLLSSVLQMSSPTIRNNTGVYYFSHLVYCRDHAVLQEPHLGVLHLPGVLLECTAFVNRCTGFTKCTAEAIMYTRSLTWMYCICHQVCCRDNHVQYMRSLTRVYCICNQVYCISYHVNQQPHLVHPSVVPDVG